MTKVSKNITQVRSRVCNWTLVAISLFAIPALAASLSRIFTIGWQFVMGIHIVLAIVVWILTIFRKSISYRIRALFIVSAFTFIGISGLLKFGLISGGIPILIIAPVLSTIFFGTRSGIIHGVFIFLITAIIGILFINQIILLDFDIVAYATHSQSWFSLLGSFLSIAAPIAATHMVVNYLMEALLHTKQKELELIRLNKELEKKVKKRTKQLEDARLYAEEQARTDELTGLFNRRAFFEYAGLVATQSQRYQHNFVIVMVDIDHFKSINDLYGHSFGDSVLVTFANTLKASLRESDILGRMGGEEFAILFPETSLEDALDVTERIRKNVEASVTRTDNNNQLQVTASFGIAEFEDQSDDILKSIIQNADAAMYCAKRAGRNRIAVYGSKQNRLINVE